MLRQCTVFSTVCVSVYNYKACTKHYTTTQCVLRVQAFTEAVKRKSCAR